MKLRPITSAPTSWRDISMTGNQMKNRQCWTDDIRDCTGGMLAEYTRERKQCGPLVSLFMIQKPEQCGWEEASKQC